MARRGLFYEPSRSKYWSGIIRIDSVEGAKYATTKLSEGWRSKLTREQKRQRIRYAVLAMNRAKAMLKKRSLSQRERNELKRVIAVYANWLEKHRLQK